MKQIDLLKLKILNMKPKELADFIENCNHSCQLCAFCFGDKNCENLEEPCLKGVTRFLKQEVNINDSSKSN